MTAARREFLEETGYKAERFLKLLDGPVSAGLTSDCVTMYRAYGLKKVSRGGGIDKTEIIDVHEIPLQRVERWLTSMRKKGFLVDPKVYAGIYFLKREFKGDGQVPKSRI